MEMERGSGEGVEVERGSGEGVEVEREWRWRGSGGGEREWRWREGVEVERGSGGVIMCGATCIYLRSFSTHPI